ncbi:MAG: glycerophosphoryl diester phosphodiesterase [Ilumatobacteraceae bacterium]|nr:glycerophosphoryl diester phosphodiesterase [Ilumatobacteraceae bacterium]
MRTRPGTAIAVLVLTAVVAAGCASGPVTAPTTGPSPPTGSPAPATTTIAPAPATTSVPQTTIAPSTTITAPTTTVASTTTAAAAPAGPLTVQQLLDLGRPIVLAHGSGEDQHPHSTPYGYAESVREGVDVLDFDVQLTADDVLVVQHDDSTGRTADRDLPIATTDYAELAALDNAYWFTNTCTCTGQPDAAYTLRGVRTGTVPPPPGYTPDDFIIPRFRDIAERFPDMPVNIEVKGSGDRAIAAAKELAAELRDLHLEDNTVVASFDDAVVDAFHADAPTVEISPGLGAASAWILQGTPLPTSMRILQLPMSAEGIDVITPATIAASHAAGYVIWVWPDDERWETADGYRWLLALGLDGLNINVPDEGVQAVRDFVAAR